MVITLKSQADTDIPCQGIYTYITLMHPGVQRTCDQISGMMIMTAPPPSLPEKEQH